MASPPSIEVGLSRRVRKNGNARLARTLLLLVRGGSDVLLRFTDSVRLRVFGRVYNYRRGEVHLVSLAMVGLLLAEDCVEPVSVDAVAKVA